ncbi:MAG: hypothetical protein P4M00_18600 [Azospirillaceae bacterium]|nr:hypothetical protein [Azospirillaceae bacterium]
MCLVLMVFGAWHRGFQGRGDKGGFRWIAATPRFALMAVATALIAACSGTAVGVKPDTTVPVAEAAVPMLVPVPKPKPRWHPAGAKLAPATEPDALAGGPPIALAPPGGGNGTVAVPPGEAPGGAVTSQPLVASIAPPVARSVRPQPPVDPASLVGLDERAATGLLGPPEQVQDQPPVRYWRYASQDCNLTLTFFMEVASQDYRALSYQLSSRTHDPDSDQRCFAELLARHGRG